MLLIHSIKHKLGVIKKNRLYANSKLNYLMDVTFKKKNPLLIKRHFILHYIIFIFTFYKAWNVTKIHYKYLYNFNKWGILINFKIYENTSLFANGKTFQYFFQSLNKTLKQLFSINNIVFLYYFLCVYNYHIILQHISLNFFRFIIPSLF